MDYCIRYYVVHTEHALFCHRALREEFAAREAEERKRREEEARLMAEQQRLRDEAQRLQEEQRALAKQEENLRLQKQVRTALHHGKSELLNC